MASIRGAVHFILACGFEDKVLSVEGEARNAGFLGDGAVLSWGPSKSVPKTF